MRNGPFKHLPGIATLIITLGLTTAGFAQTTVTSCGDQLSRLTESRSNLADAQARLQSLQGQLRAMQAPQGASSAELAQHAADRLAREQEMTRQQILTEQLGSTHQNLIANYNGTCIGQ